jgi:hypothetical protein
MNPNLLVLSHATYVGPSGATAAATHAFFTKDYRPPAEERYVETDIVKNQNGRFKYVYDNGPGFRVWSPFSIVCEEKFADVVGGNAQTQYANLRKFWNHPGLLGMRAPDGTYIVHWTQSSIEQNFRVFPIEASPTSIEYEVVVQFEEAS